MGAAIVNGSGHAVSDAKNEGKAAQTAIATCLVGVAYLGLIAFAVHFARAHPPDDHVWHGNDTDLIGSVLGLVWFLSALVATILARSLRSPARELILMLGGGLTVLSVALWLCVGISR
jgi:hypothetical protein